MSLRNRLFLWISTLFLLAGATVYVLEVFVTAKEMDKARYQLRKKIIGINEKKRQEIESFLASVIGENQARVDVLLQRLSSYPLQAAAFAPTQINYDRGTWLMASEILNSNKWLDFIQNTNEGKLASVIMPRVSALDYSVRIEINDDVAWVLMGDLSKHPEPYLGVRLRFNRTDISTRVTGNEVVETTGQVPKGYLLFSWKQLLFPDPSSLQTPVFTGVLPPIQINLSAPWTDGSQLNPSAFLTAFQVARKYLIDGLGQVGKNDDDRVRAWIESECKNHGQDINHVTLPKNLHRNVANPFLKKELDELAMRYDQLYLIWCLAIMNELHIFGEGFFSPGAPQGLVVHFGKQPFGEGIHTQDVFFPKAGFDDQQYYSQGSTSGVPGNVSPGIAVFRPFNLSHVFLGNTAQYRVQDGDVQKTGYLTLGVDADGVLRGLVLATQQAAFLITEGKLMVGFSDEGKKLDVSQETKLPLGEILSNRSGMIRWGNEDYYYIQMTPFSNLDLHFVLANPAEKEFALLNSLNESAEMIISSLLWNIHIIGFVILVLTILILHYLSRRITSPISQLATATKEIGEGHLESAAIPVPSEKDTDEVASLCRAFDRMVKGLQEKEKVKAVLNKVVSQEIAQEILKGNVALGGEEKKVTILFADIRNFTRMTQNMTPKEVIDLLNVCMTKISHFIDQYGGVIDKYVGDEAMALFGAPVECRESAYKAILSAIDMINALGKWNEERRTQGLPPVQMGIGIHTGAVLAGNMGAENRLNYTVLGNNVNLAARLCSAAVGMEILISESTLKEPLVMEKILIEEIPPMALKGFDMPIVTYRVKGLKSL